MQKLVLINEYMVLFTITTAAKIDMTENIYHRIRRVAHVLSAANMFCGNVS